MMTAKERQQMQRLEIENRELRERHAKDMISIGDAFIENIELRATIDLIKSALRGDE